jgi:prephenate dehydrogenase
MVGLPYGPTVHVKALGLSIIGIGLVSGSIERAIQSLKYRVECFDNTAYNTSEDG